MTTPTIQKYQSPYLNENISQIIKSNTLKYNICRVAKTVNALAIFILITTITSFFSSSIEILVLGHIIIVASIPILGFGYIKINNLSKKYFNTKLLYTFIKEETLKLKTQNPTQIKNFLNSIDIKKPFSNDDLKKILPLIARYKYYTKKRDELNNEINEMSKIQLNDSDQRLKLQKSIHSIYEKYLLKYKLKAAEIFYHINNLNEKRTLEKMGNIYPLNFDKRMASLFQGSDIYFIFNNDIRKKRKLDYLSFTTVDTSTIEQLSKYIFVT